MVKDESSVSFSVGLVLGWLFIVFFILTVFALPWSIGMVQIFKFFSGA